MKWMVAPSYKYATIIKVNEETHKAFISEKCDRCGGRGIVAARVENGNIIPIPVDGGVCYKCNGEGTVTKWVKAYTEKEYDQYVRTQERAKEKRVEKEKARLAKLDQEAEENKAAWLINNGFDTIEPIVYLIGGNTYEIKDWIKERGGRYNPALGWFFANATYELPDGHEYISVPFDSLYDWFPRTKRMELKENAKEVADAAKISILPESKSEWVGEIKERLRDLRVTLTGRRECSGMYGDSILFTFEDEAENILTWFTTRPPEIEIGHSYLLTGTVKKFTEYNGVKQTQLNRCILKEN